MAATAAVGTVVVIMMVAAGAAAVVSALASTRASMVTPDTTTMITMIVRDIATTVTAAIGIIGTIAVGANNAPRLKRPGLLVELALRVTSRHCRRRPADAIQDKDADRITDKDPHPKQNSGVLKHGVLHFQDNGHATPLRLQRSTRHQSRRNQ
ncbi:MAG: hypothetical protein Q7T86_16715 [Hyphomicrobiaceae bacterium]|nr:hypothetical protein [Hyphomicrobiaceae bacterium]